MTVEANRLVYLAVIERLEIGPATLGPRSVDTERITLERQVGTAFLGPRRNAARAPRPVQ